METDPDAGALRKLSVCPQSTAVDSEHQKEHETDGCYVLPVALSATFPLATLSHFFPTKLDTKKNNKGFNPRISMPTSHAERTEAVGLFEEKATKTIEKVAVLQPFGLWRWLEAAFA